MISIGQLMVRAMHHRWLLLVVCSWTLLTLAFVGKLVSFRAEDVGSLRSWTAPRPKRVKDAAVASTESRDPKPTDQCTETPSDHEWTSIHEKRIELLSSVCQNSSLRNLTHVPISKFVLDRIFVCDKHKILFCQTPKVGNTQWKKVLLVLNGKYSTPEKVPEKVIHNHPKNGLRRLASFSQQEITRRLNTYFKFLIVRDPFERLISAFKDKFVNNPRYEPWYKSNIAPVIIRKYRKKHKYNESTPDGLHFEDFVRYLGDPVDRHYMDQQFGSYIIHWVTYTELCAPCAIQYNVVGHHETLEQDAPYIIRAAGVKGLVSYPNIPPGITRYNRTKVEQYFSGISKRDIRRLFARYEGDFHLFGYPRPDFLLNEKDEH